MGENRESQRKDDVEEKAQQHLFEPENTDEGKVTASTLEAIMKLQRGKCYYSGQTLTLENVSCDHLQPLTRGGKHVPSNVVLCTKQVNQMKGTMTESEFVSLCLEIGSYG